MEEVKKTYEKQVYPNNQQEEQRKMNPRWIEKLLWASAAFLNSTLSLGARICLLHIGTNQGIYLSIEY